jgi:hypothetical protein
MNFVRSASRGIRSIRAGTMLLFALATSASTSAAQTEVQLAFGGSVSFGAPTAADYSAGSLEAATPLPFEVMTTSELSGSFTTTVSIRSSTATLGSGKPVATMEWRRGDDPTWHALTTTDAVVESRLTQGAPEGHTWDNTIHFRVALNWASDKPATYTGNLIITVSATQP